MPLFKTQSVVDDVREEYVQIQETNTTDQLVDDLAATLNVSRGDLNVVCASHIISRSNLIPFQRASPKGLFCGSGLSIHLKQGGVVHGTDSEVRVLVPL